MEVGVTIAAGLSNELVNPGGSKNQHIARDLRPHLGRVVSVTTDGNESHLGVLVAVKGDPKYTGVVLTVDTPDGPITLFPSGPGRYTRIELVPDPAPGGVDEPVAVPPVAEQGHGTPARLASPQAEPAADGTFPACPAELPTDDSSVLATAYSIGRPYPGALDVREVRGSGPDKRDAGQDVCADLAMASTGGDQTTPMAAMSQLEVVKDELVGGRPAEVLALIDQARARLASVRDPSEAAWFVRRTDAIDYYAKKAKAGEAVQNEAVELALRAKRRAGELLAAREAPRGRRTDLEPRDTLSPGPLPTLKELGVESHDSKRWRRIAAVPEEDFEVYVGDKTRELTTAGLLAAANTRAKAERQTQVAAIPADGEVGEISALFPTIVVNPSWHRDTFKQLEALELPAADDAHLYLWVTNEMLRRGFDFLDQWRFTYKACLTWVKPRAHLGNWFPDATEHVLFGVRGRLPLLCEDVPNWFEGPPAEGSAKPDAFYELVESCSPAPRLEMFSRETRPGWSRPEDEA